MSLKKFDDNFNSLIKSLKPIKDKFSKQSYQHDKYFKKSSIEALEKNLYGPKKSPENFFTSKLYKSVDFMYNLSNDCYDYIENLEGLKNIPIKVNKKGFNFVKNLYNPEFETRPEDRYFFNDNKQNHIYNLKKYYKNKKIFKFAVYALDPGYYHPNYNFVKKRIPSIDFSKSPNSHQNNEFAKISEDNNFNYIKNIDNKEKIVDKNNKIQLENKKLNMIESQQNKQIKEIEKNVENDNQENMENEQNNNLSSIQSRDYQNNMGNMSQSTVHSKKEELKNYKKINLPKIIYKTNSQINISTPVMINFKKMMGREVVKKDKDLKLIEKTDIEYKPNYDITLPHVRSFRFKSIGNKQNHKKYMIGKILRSYSFNSYGYYVMDIKKKKKS